MKLSFIEGKALAIVGIEINDAMSAFGIPGSIPAIREIKVGAVERGPVGSRCTVKVIFWENLYTKITFKGEPASKPSLIHWRVTRVVTSYYGDSINNSRNLYLY